MKKFAVIDCETDPFAFGRLTIAPFLWGYYDGETYEEFTETADLVRFISGRKEIIYAHNGGKFDYHFLTDYLEPGTNIMIINGRLAKIKLGECELRDSFNILPVALSEYQKTEIDYSIFEPAERIKPHNMKMIRDYLYDDCKFLYEIVAAFLDEYGYSLTQAGAAMKYFKTQYELDKIQTSENFFNHFRPYYYGGRVQCFEKGIIDKPFSVFDINSAYPYAMLSDHWFDEEISATRKPAEYAIDCPQAFFNIECVARGCFPWREKVGDKLIYPNDNVKRRYMVSGWELKAALENNAITSRINIEAVYIPKKTINFSDFILPTYEERKEAKRQGNKARTLLLKLRMNSLYGKFGADPTNYTRAIIFDPSYYGALQTGGVHWKDGKESPYADDPLYTLAGTLGPFCIGARPLETFERHYYNVATAASITGYVRAYLFNAICKSEGVLYCDTDSLACESGAGLSLGGELGQWKDEGRYHRAAIAGRKMYAFFGDGETKTASKGVRLSADQIEVIARGGAVTAQKDAPNFSVRYGMRYVSRKVVATG